MSGMSFPRAEIDAAAKRAGGSVKEARRLLQGESAKLDSQVQEMLAQLPDLDWRDVHALGDAVHGRENEAAYEA